MIQKVYYGNVEYLGSGSIATPAAPTSTIATPKDKGLYVSTFDVGSVLDPGYAGGFPQDEGVVKKVDILFYNRTNTLGKVLSSIVYLGESRDASDTSDIPYFPEQMYKNSPVEEGWDLTCLTDYSYVNWEREAAGAESYFVQQKEKDLPLNGYPANIVNRDTPVLDGWYTLASVGVYVEPPWDGGVWTGYHTGCFALKSTWDEVRFSLVQEPGEAVFTDWHQYDIWDNTIQLLGHFVNEDYTEDNCLLEPPFIRQDFFIMSNYDREYMRYLPGYVKEPAALNAPFPSLKCKQRVIDRALSENNFKEAQLYLQSTDFLRIKENII